MSAAKQEITASIRRALGQRSVPPALGYAAIQREYKQGGSLAAEDRLNMFAERLHDYDAVLHRCSEENIAETIARILLARDKRTMLVSSSVPAAWRPAGYAFIEDRGLTYGEIDRSEGVLTTCSVAIAVTGTIVLRHSSEEGRRAITLIPDYHLCVVHASSWLKPCRKGFA